MSFTAWKIDRIEHVHPEAFYKLVNKNRNHIGKTFPVTLANSDSLKKAEDFLAVSLDKEKNNEGFYFYARDIKTNDLIGYLCVKTIDYRILKCELGYFADEDYQGKGVTSKMVSDALDFCFNELKMNKVFICTSEINMASQRIALKHNFKQEGILRDEFRNGDGELQNTVYFGLLKSEYNTHER
ncbi:GNAT family N-acetyltransferase [Flavobacterium sp. JLP]|uniref:GNAT family N-acetyltransferase n=1 Tax=unclassified Flavobacterium TaxID=196869 RepID=UPI00188ACB7D|nr:MULTISPECIES: GNAT family protein [unclassified Flavobacterium]MBF4492507.1 GNAT family N-acetyltransferase [Flavobacterium sp. MR2016-29]MBF4506214.1 GNAT family N-acetyltransferase [Flavobacterium sp. JLP]